MNEVEKMYENAGVKPLPTCNNCNMLDEYWSNGTYCSTCKYDKDNDECNMANYIYPPFTAEKQIELIKLLTQQCDLTISYFKEWEFVYYDGQEALEITGNNFAETFAKLVNSYWEDLTEKERKQIKSILE